LAHFGGLGGHGFDNFPRALWRTLADLADMADMRSLKFPRTLAALVSQHLFTLWAIR
jgi:hypothetical protein